MTRMLTALWAGLALATAGFATIVQAQPPAMADALTDPTLKRAEVLAFIGVKPGDRIVDVVAGRFVRALSQVVGPKGKVYAMEPAEVVKVHPDVVNVIKGLAAMPDYANVELITAPIGAPALPKGVDAVFIRQNYHDLHDKFMGRPMWRPSTATSSPP